MFDMTNDTDDELPVEVPPAIDDSDEDEIDEDNEEIADDDEVEDESVK